MSAQPQPVTRLACRAVATAGLLVVQLTGCGKPVTGNDAHEMLNATLWQQSSAEYKIIAWQTYRLAQTNLELALVDRKWSAALEQQGDYTDLPPAIVLDLDETVFDNTAYEAAIIREFGQFTPESFARWCNAEAAAAVAGVREFLDYAVSRQVDVFYYSARKESLRDCTRGNLQSLGLPFADNGHLLLDDGTTKPEHRAMIASRYRVLLLVGDSLEDFMSGSKADSDTRNKLAQHYAERWGREWIMLPNPMYGHWESTTYGFDYSLPRDQRLLRKHEALRQAWH